MEGKRKTRLGGLQHFMLVMCATKGLNEPYFALAASFANQNELISLFPGDGVAHFI